MVKGKEKSSPPRRPKGVQSHKEHAAKPIPVGQSFTNKYDGLTLCILVHLVTWWFAFSRWLTTSAIDVYQSEWTEPEFIAL